jgi:hypothetical protein
MRQIDTSNLDPRDSELALNLKNDVRGSTNDSLYCSRCESQPDQHGGLFFKNH